MEMTIASSHAIPANNGEAINITDTQTKQPKMDKLLKILKFQLKLVLNLKFNFNYFTSDKTYSEVSN